MQMNNWLTCVLSLESRVTKGRNVNLMEASFALLNLKGFHFSGKKHCKSREQEYHRQILLIPYFQALQREMESYFA